MCARVLYGAYNTDRYTFFFFNDAHAFKILFLEFSNVKKRFMIEIFFIQIFYCVWCTRSYYLISFDSIKFANNNTLVFELSIILKRVIISYTAQSVNENTIIFRLFSNYIPIVSYSPRSSSSEGMGVEITMGGGRNKELAYIYICVLYTWDNYANLL